MGNRDGGDVWHRQRRTDRLHVRVDDDLRFEPETEEAVVGILGDRCGAADAIDLDPCGGQDELDGACHFAPIQDLERILQRLQVALEDLVDHGRQVVAPFEILVDELNRLHQVACQCELHLLETACADLLAQSDYAALARLRPLCDFRHRHVYDLRRMRDDEVGNSRGRGRQGEPNGRQPIEDALKRDDGGSAAGPRRLGASRQWPFHRKTSSVGSPACAGRAAACSPAAAVQSRMSTKCMPSRPAPTPSVSGLSPITAARPAGIPRIRRAAANSAGSGLPITRHGRGPTQCRTAATNAPVSGTIVPRSPGCTRSALVAMSSAPAWTALAAAASLAYENRCSRPITTTSGASVTRQRPRLPA